MALVCKSIVLERISGLCSRAQSGAEATERGFFLQSPRRVRSTRLTNFAIWPLGYKVFDMVSGMLKRFSGQHKALGSVCVRRCSQDVRKRQNAWEMHATVAL